MYSRNYERMMKVLRNKLYANNGYNFNIPVPKGKTISCEMTVYANDKEYTVTLFYYDHELSVLVNGNYINCVNITLIDNQKTLAIRVARILRLTIGDIKMGMYDELEQVTESTTEQNTVDANIMPLPVETAQEVTEAPKEAQQEVVESPTRTLARNCPHYYGMYIDTDSCMPKVLSPALPIKQSLNRNYVLLDKYKYIDEYYEPYGDEESARYYGFDYMNGAAKSKLITRIQRLIDILTYHTELRWILYLVDSVTVTLKSDYHYYTIYVHSTAEPQFNPKDVPYFTLVDERSNTRGEIEWYLETLTQVLNKIEERETVWSEVDK